jgi:uncharacterized OB-fold protein
MERQFPQRRMPYVNEMNAHFWEGGADGRLHILRCQACGTWIHPFAGRCPKCFSDALAPEPTSGLGVVVGFTINYQMWVPGMPTPFVVAIVALEEQSNIRLMTNLPRIPIDEVKVGLKVKVYFEQNGDVYYPLFEAA